MPTPSPTAQEVALALAVVRKSSPAQAEVLARAITCKAAENTRLKSRIRDLERENLHQRRCTWSDS